MAALSLSLSTLELCDSGQKSASDNVWLSRQPIKHDNQNVGRGQKYIVELQVGSLTECKVVCVWFKRFTQVER